MRSTHLRRIAGLDPAIHPLHQDSIRNGWTPGSSPGVTNAMANASSGSWIGARLLRKEDARYLLGAGMFIADIRMPGLQDVAFVRSQMAHARLRQVVKPPDAVARVFTLA